MRRKRFVSNFAKYRSLFRKNFVHSFFFFGLLSWFPSVHLGCACFFLRIFSSEMGWRGGCCIILLLKKGDSKYGGRTRRQEEEEEEEEEDRHHRIFFIIETSLSLAAYSFSTVFAYLLSSFLDQQMVCVCVSSPAISSLPTCSMEVFHKNWRLLGSVLSVNARYYFVLLFFYSLSVHIGGLFDCRH